MSTRFNQCLPKSNIVSLMSFYKIVITFNSYDVVFIVPVVI